MGCEGTISSLRCLFVIFWRLRGPLVEAEL